MTAGAPQGGPPALVSIEGEMTIWRASELKQALMAPFEQPEPGPIELDLSQVSEIDMAGFQLLLLARQMADARGQRLRLSGCSDAVAALLALLGLVSRFDGAAAPGEGA